MPFEIANSGGKSAVLILCDHATNIIPDSVNGGSLGLPDSEMNRHIAFDIGARGVALELARLMDGTGIFSRFSRLVIDPNRGEDDPTLVMRLYDGTVIPANRNIQPDEKQRRLETWHRPYHNAVTEQIDRLTELHPEPALISVHSYTPRLKGRKTRPWHVGVLWHHDGRLAVPLMEQLRSDPELCIGDNQPYSGELEGDTMSRHGTRRGLPHVLIELRHDLIETESDQQSWAARLAPVLNQVIDNSRRKATNNG